MVYSGASEHPIKIDDLGVPRIMDTPTSTLCILVPWSVRPMTMCIDDPTCHENLRENPLIDFHNSPAHICSCQGQPSGSHHSESPLVESMEMLIIHEIKIEIGIAILTELFLLVLSFHLCISRTMICWTCKLPKKSGGLWVIHPY